MLIDKFDAQVNGKMAQREMPAFPDRDCHPNDSNRSLWLFDFFLIDFAA